MSRYSLITVVLVTLVALRLLLQSLYVPAFEGPDEPFHLARAVAFAEKPCTAGIEGRWVGSDIVESVAHHPCAASLSNTFGCPLFSNSPPAAFNVLHFSEATGFEEHVRNYEQHQPPLYYLAGASMLAFPAVVAPSSRATHNPVLQLLLMRLFSVLIVFFALCGPLLTVSRSLCHSWFLSACILLLVPGAAESLARCANDAGVFAWAAVLMWAIHRSARTPVVIALLAIGPLIKLTALPAVVVGVVWLLQHRPRWHAACAAVASLAVLPVQWLRGFAWGGTLELNAASQAVHEPFVRSLVGFVRSTYTLLKTTFWLGEWSFFRPPLFVLLLCVVFVLGFALSLRIRPFHVDSLPHVAGLLTLTLTITVFFISHRLYWHQWGGVGGWYLWGLMPWLAVAFHSLFRVSPDRSRTLLWSALALAVVSNIAWFSVARGVYG
jgi:hypothetical protein